MSLAGFRRSLDMKHNGILGRHYGFVAHDVTVNKWFFTPAGKHSVALCTCGSSTYKLLNFMKFLEVSGDFLFLCGCQFTLPVRDDLPALSFGVFYSDNSRSLGSVRALGSTLNCFLFCIWKMEEDAWSSPTTTTTTTTTYVAIVLLWKHASYVAKKSYKILLSCTTMCTFVAERGLF